MNYKTEVCCEKRICQSNNDGHCSLPSVSLNYQGVCVDFERFDAERDFWGDEDKQ